MGAPVPFTLREAASQLRAAQDHREAAYVRLRTAFQRLLADSDEAAYRGATEAATVDFAAVNGAVRAVEGRLKAEMDLPQLAQVLRTLQESEREKLRFTLILQALKKAGSLGTFSWQQGSGAASHAAQQPGLGAAGRHPGGCGCTPAEPSEDDFNGAVAEATKGLQEAMVNGSAAYDEFREAVAEAEEDE